MSVRRFWRRAHWDDERAKELEAYLEIETDANVARGMNERDARLAARRKLGNPTLVREEIFQMNTVTFLDNAWRDVKHGARLLRMNPGFAAVAILSLALGVGANTAVFQLLDAVRLRTLPVRNPSELVEIRIADAPNGRTGNFTGRRPMMTNPLLAQVQEHQQAFSGLAAWGAIGFNMATEGEARNASGMFVNGDFFSTLGVSPLVGRLIGRADDRRGCAAPAAVLSYGFWQREYGGDPSAIGRSLTLERHAYEIVGVTPPQFFGLEVGRTFDVAVPLCAEPLARVDSGLDKPDVWFLAVFGRLKPDWTVERATAQLAAISPAIFKATLPQRYRPDDVRDYLAFHLGAFPAGTGVSSLRRDYEAPLWMLLGTTGLVLVIACANLANLMLARATAREREIAVRLAIGASRGRVARQLFAESLLLAALGGVGGIIVAKWSSGFLVSLMTTESNRMFVDLATDWRVFTFTGGLALLTCVIFGLAPALRATAQEPGVAMKAGNRGSTDSRERFGFRRSLVVVQVAMSLVLVVGALLFVRSLRNLMVLDAGFRQNGILIVDLDYRGTTVTDAGRRPAFDAMTARLRSLPGVDSAAEAFIVPVSGQGWNNRVVIGGTARPENVNFNFVGPSYFRTMATPMLAGRDFDDRDVLNARKVVIVTEQFARKFFGGQSAIGRTFQIEEGAGVERPVYEIVGLVKDAKYTDLREEFTPIVYVAAGQREKIDPFLKVMIRSGAPLDALTTAVTAAVSSAQPGTIVEFQTLNVLIRDSLMRERLMAMLSGFFGLLAGLLATIGLYGVMSYMVERRRNEIGIRIALGADRSAVIAMIMREAATLLVVGLVIGGLAAVGASRWASALLFGLRPGDPVALATGVLALSIVATLASYVPAWRASRLEPTVALREE
jgi:predicted permease